MTKKKKRGRDPLWFESPFEDMRRVQEEINRGMREMWLGPWLRMPELMKLREFPRTKFIPVRFGETGEELILRAEIPGFSKDEVKLKVTPRKVFISAEKKKQIVEKDKTYFRMEKGYSSASRVLILPKEVKTEGVKARFKDGVLEVVLKKKEKEEKKGKEVKIE